MVVLDALKQMNLQSGLLILREAYTGYVPMGVFNVRENIKKAMEEPYKEFEDLKSAVRYVGSNLKIPLSRYVKSSHLLNELLHTKQTSLDAFFKKEHPN